MYKGENWLTVPATKLGSAHGGVAAFCPVHGMVSCSMLPLGQSGFSEPLPPRLLPSDPQGDASPMTPFSGKGPLPAAAERFLKQPWGAGLGQLLPEGQVVLPCAV